MRDGGLGDDEIAEIIGRAAENEDDDCFAVWFENRRAFELFLVLGTQWRVGGMGGFLGMDYAAAVAVMNVYRIKDQRAMLLDLRAMERAALAALNAAKDGNG